MKLKPNLRTKIIIYSVLLTLFWAFPLITNISSSIPIPTNLFIRSLVMGSVSYFVLWLILGIKTTSYKKHLFVLLPTALSVFLISLFLYFLIPKLTERFIYKTMAAVVIAFFSLFIYFSSLMANILHKSIDDPLPLVKAARTAFYIISLITIFITTTLFLSIDIDVWVAMLIVTILVLFYLFVNLWYTSLADKESFRFSILGTLIVVFGFIVLINWPINISLIALSLTYIIYMYLGLIFNVLNGTFVKTLWVEYALLGIVLSYILLKFSDWGINQIPFLQ